MELPKRKESAAVFQRIKHHKMLWHRNAWTDRTLTPPPQSMARPPSHVSSEKAKKLIPKAQKSPKELKCPLSQSIPKLKEQLGVTEFAQPYVPTDVQSVLCQLSTSSRFTCLKEIFLKDMLLPEVTTRDAHLRLLCPPFISQDTL